MCVAMLLLSSLSIARYAGYNAAMLDLGNMAQAIWSVTEGKPLVFTQPFGAYSRLSGHAEVIYFLLAPLYAFWPDPRLLLTVQALLYALGALPVYAMAMRRIESVFAARCLALIYLLYPVAQTAVLFDFHGDTLAMPLLLFALDALDARAWRRYAVFIALALLCKVYVAAPVFGIGAYAFVWGGQRRVGLLTMLSAFLYGSIVFFGVRPLFAIHTDQAIEVSQEYIAYYFGAFDLVLATLDQRVLNAIIVFGPILLAAWRGWRWLLPGLPVAVAALITSGPGGGFDYRYHHYALVVPFIMMAAIDGMHRAKLRSEQKGAGATITKRRGRSWHGDLGLSLAIVIIFNMTMVDTPFNPLFWLGIPGRGLDASAYGITPRDQIKSQFLAEMVPPEMPIAASNFLAPHLANRSTLYLLRYPDEPDAERLPTLLPQVDYALADALFDYYIPLDGGYGGGVDYERGAISILLSDPAFGLVTAQDGLILFQRNAPSDRILTQQVEIISSTPNADLPQYTFGDTIALLQYNIVVRDERRIRASFIWQTTRSLSETPLVAVSHLEGVFGTRIVHLPTYSLLPTTQWSPGQLIQETFEAELPANLPAGQYAWQIGWYDMRSPFAAMTDQRSLLPNSRIETLSMITIPRK